MSEIWSDGRPSVFQQVTDAIAARGDAPRELEVNLAEREPQPENKIRFVAGALDQLFGTPDKSERQVTARSIVAALTKAVRHPSKDAYQFLYRKLCDAEPISVMDETLNEIAPQLETRRVELAALARRLIREAPDVEPIKFGVALLGISGVPDDEVVLQEIGQYEELTLFCGVALSNLLDKPEPAIFRLAQRVHGWGRIALIERLAETSNREIKNWLLREGFRNTIMYEYLAYISATVGGLLSSLEASEIDDDLLLAAGDILSALIHGGPAEEIDDYSDGAPACVAFLQHANQRNLPSLNTVQSVLDIQSIASGERAEQLRGTSGWTAPLFMKIRTLAAAFLQKPGARAAVEAGLASQDNQDFFIAAQIAPTFGIDPWPLRLSRQQKRIDDEWYFLMQTDDEERIEQVLELARQQLDLAKVGSGPTDSLALGLEYSDDQALDFILQDLNRFPGRGWDLIKIGLQARGVRCRNMAIKALKGWPRDVWPPDVMRELRAAVEREPEADVKERLEDLIANRLED